MLAYKHVIELAGPVNHRIIFEQVEDLTRRLASNLSDKLIATPTNELAETLDLLPAPQLASVLATLLAPQPGVSDLFGERLQIISYSTSRLVSLLLDEDLTPENFEFVNQAVSIPVTEELPLMKMGRSLYNTASFLSYKSIYLPTTQATTPKVVPQLPTSQATTQASTSQATTQPPTPQAVLQLPTLKPLTPHADPLSTSELASEVAVRLASLPTLEAGTY
jgi:hypothetical protein